MRKLAFALLLLSGHLLVAQTDKEQLAREQYQKFNDKGKPKDLENARANIDAVFTEYGPKHDAGEWVLRGDIYLVSYSNSSLTNAEAPDNYLEVATSSYLSAKILDTGFDYVNEIANGLRACKQYSDNAGIANYNLEKYAAATDCFARSVSISESNGVTDTVIMYNAALAAYKSGQFARAITWLKPLTTWNYEKVNCWWTLAQCYLETRDTAKYEVTIEEGLVKNPGDGFLIGKKIEIRIDNGDPVAADQLVLAFIGGGSLYDAAVNLAVGNIYDQLANPMDEAQNELPKPWCYEKMVERARIYYQKAIDLKPDYFDAIYNMGVLHYNLAAWYYNRSASGIPGTEKYDALWQPEMRIGAEYLERARSLKPGDPDTLRSLKICYGYLGEREKRDAIILELEKIEGDK